MACNPPLKTHGVTGVISSALVSVFVQLPILEMHSKMHLYGLSLVGNVMLVPPLLTLHSISESSISNHTHQAGYLEYHSHEI